MQTDSILMVLGLVGGAMCALCTARGLLRGACVLWCFGLIRAVYVGCAGVGVSREAGVWLVFGWLASLVYCAVWSGLRAVAVRILGSRRGPEEGVAASGARHWGRA